MEKPNFNYFVLFSTLGKLIELINCIPPFKKRLAFLPGFKGSEGGLKMEYLLVENLNDTGSHFSYSL